MFESISFPLLKESFRFSPFRKWFLAISVCLCLLDVSRGTATAEALLRTLIVPADGGLTSSVANAGELVSPALISPPSPLDLLLRGLSLLLSPERGPNLSVLVVESRGNASVAVIVERLNIQASNQMKSCSTSENKRSAPMLQRRQNGVT